MPRTYGIWQNSQGRSLLQYKKEERSQINNLILYLKELEKEEKAKPQLSRSQETTKIISKINKVESGNRAC